jgi:hypothetical protein
VNAAVLMFTACLAGPGQVPAPMPPAAYPAPVMVYPGQAYGGSMGGCCGHASVDCCDHDCCLLKKIKDKICCIHIHITCDKGPSCCEHGPVCPKPCAPACAPKPVCAKPCPPPCPPKPVCNPCPPKPVCNPCPPKPVCNPCPPKPVCNPCPKPVCCPKPACEKPTCCKVEPVCHAPSTCCWTPGYCLHKCKEKLCGLCDHGGCHGGCGTAATPNACGSSVIAPVPDMVVPAPVTPAPPKAMPDVKKVGSAYNLVRPELTPVSGTAPRVIDLTPSPF